MTESTTQARPPAGDDWTASGPIETAIDRAQVAAAVRLRGASAVKGAPQRYVGLVTRLLAFAVDAVIINLVAAITWAIVALTMNTLNLPDNFKTFALAVLSVVYVLWAAAYFVSFWSGTGQTPGGRALECRVVDEDDGRPITAKRALLRFIGMVLGAIPFGAGYFIGLFNERCRCFLDIISDSVVIDAPVYTVADRRRMARDAAINRYKPRFSAADQHLGSEKPDAGR